MTDARPFTVVCVADDSRSTERVDLVENTFVAFVMAENVSEAMAAGQVQAAESGLGPNEPIDWAVVREYLCRLRHGRECIGGDGGGTGSGSREWLRTERAN